MEKDTRNIDVILDLLNQVQNIQPSSTFINSLLEQYRQRGSLSKKQLEGLYSKASKIKTINVSKLATLQAIILKKHSKERSKVTISAHIVTGDAAVEKMLADILAKYPAHKRVLFFKANYDDKKTLTPVEKAELEKFHKLLCKS